MRLVHSDSSYQWERRGAQKGIRQIIAAVMGCHVLDGRAVRHTRLYGTATQAIAYSPTADCISIDHWLSFAE